MGSFFPTPQVKSEVSGPDPGQLVQLAMAVRQMKTQEALQKKTEAQSNIQRVMQNPQMLLMTDPGEIEKWWKDAGYGKLQSPDQILSQSQPAPSPAPAGGGGTAPTPPPVSGNAVQAVGVATQPKGGAQAANPPSKEAGAKSPGGGVTPTGIDVNRLTDAATQAFQQKLGAVGSLYGQAFTAQQAQYAQMVHAQHINQLKEQALNGDMRAMGALYVEAGKPITDQDMRGMMIASDDPDVRKKAIDFALGAETPGDKAKRVQSTLHDILGNPDIMGKLQNPADAQRMAQGIVETGVVPPDVKFKERSFEELAKTSDYALKLIDKGLPLEWASKVAEAQAHGIPMSDVLPSSIASITTVPQQEAMAKVASSNADVERARAGSERAILEGKRIDLLLAEHGDDELKAQLGWLVEAKKAGQQVPDEIANGILANVGSKLGLTQQDVRHWYAFGIFPWTYKAYAAQSKLDPSEKEGQIPAPKGRTTSDQTPPPSDALEQIGGALSRSAGDPSQ